MRKPIKEELIINGRKYVFVKAYPEFLLYRDKFLESIKTCIPWVDTGLIPVGDESKYQKARDTENYMQEKERKRWFA